MGCASRPKRRLKNWRRIIETVQIKNDTRAQKILAGKFALREKTFAIRDLFRNVKGLPPLSKAPTVNKILLSKQNPDIWCRASAWSKSSQQAERPQTAFMDVNGSRRAATCVEQKNLFECAGLTKRDTVLVAVALDRCLLQDWLTRPVCANSAARSCAWARRQPRLFWKPSSV